MLNKKNITNAKNDILDKILLKSIHKSEYDVLLLQNQIRQRSSKNVSLRVGVICNLLNIDIETLSIILGYTNIKYKIDSPNQRISAKKLKFLSNRIHYIYIRTLNMSGEKTHKDELHDLIINSNTLTTLLESDLTHIKLIELVKTLNIGINYLCKLLKSVNINTDCNPNSKVSCNQLKQLINNNTTSNNIPLTNHSNTYNFNKTQYDKLNNLNNKINNNKITHIINVSHDQFIRDKNIKQYVKIRANGVCDLCSNPAPFIDKEGIPFLETHHVVYLSRGGEDSTDNVVALCPNCHRKIHYQNLESDIHKLFDKLKEYKQQSNFA